MAPSRALRRNIVQVRTYTQSSYGILVSRATTNNDKLIDERSPISTSRRAFNTSSVAYDDSKPPSSSSPTNTRPNTSSPFNRSRSPAGPRRSIDLSTITSNPDYNKPPRDKDAESAQARKLGALKPDTVSAVDSLLLDARSNSPKPTLSSFSSSSRPPSRFNIDTYSKGRTTTATSSTGTSSRDPRSSTLLADLFGSKARTAQSPTSLFAAPSVRDLTADYQRESLGVALRLKPVLGKTVRVNSGTGFDLTRAFQSLEGKINGRGNAVKKDEKSQKFHIRKGMLKKIERRARWRVLFKEGYLAEIGRVRKMIKQGW